MDSWLALEEEPSDEESKGHTYVKNSGNKFVHETFELF